jgi:hypothetical protein
MKCKVIKVTAAIAVVLGVAAETAWAFPPSNPYRPTGAEIVGMLDRTGDYSGNSQASTGVRTPKLDGSGVQANVVWSTGAPFVNETFTRYVLVQRFPSDTGDGDGGDLEAFDGVSWNIMSDTPVQVKPFTQTYNGFTYYEGSQNLGSGAGVIPVPANTPTVVSIDWDEVGAGSIPAANRGNIFEFGFQIFGPSVPQNGSTVLSTMMITTTIPEPASIGLALVGGFALAGLGYRGRRK